jgi:hypothetical protein
MICSELCRFRFIESLLGPSAHRDSHSHRNRFSGAGRCDNNCNGIVNITDLLTLLSEWGSSCSLSGQGGAPQSIADCLAAYPDDPDTGAKCIERLYQAGVIAPEECP